MEVEESVQEEQTAETQEQPQEPSRPAGYDPVDLSDLDPQKAKAIEDRIGYLYKQVKENSKSVSGFREVAAQQAALIEELRSGVGQVVDHLKTEKYAETEATLERQMQEAWESGDQKGYLKAQKQIIDFKTKMALEQNQPRPQKQPQQTQQHIRNVQQLAQESETDGELSPQDAQYLTLWASETDERGNLVRPWTNNPDPSNPDPDFVKAALIANQILERNPGTPINQVLIEVDKRMGVQKTQGQSVMGGNLTRPAKSSTIRLTPQQEKIAVRTKFGGPKAKSDADHIAAYRKQIEEVQKAKGAKR